MPLALGQGHLSVHTGDSSRISSSSSRGQACDTTGAGTGTGSPGASGPSVPPPLTNITLYPPDYQFSSSGSTTGSASHAATSPSAINAGCATSRSSGSEGCADQIRRLLLFVGALEEAAGVAVAPLHLPLNAPLPPSASMGRSGPGDVGSSGSGGSRAVRLSAAGQGGSQQPGRQSCSSSRAGRLTAAAAEALPAQPPPSLLALLHEHQGQQQESQLTGLHGNVGGQIAVKTPREMALQQGQQQGSQEGREGAKDAAAAGHPPVLGAAPPGALSALQQGAY
eukprot:1160997-Pelagomonas_calceolata.AAC.11